MVKFSNNVQQFYVHFGIFGGGAVKDNCQLLAWNLTKICEESGKVTFYSILGTGEARRILLPEGKQLRLNMRYLDGNIWLVTVRVYWLVSRKVTLAFLEMESKVHYVHFAYTNTVDCYCYNALAATFSWIHGQTHVTAVAPGCCVSR
jgi:hypothetical protein